jgi:hypothetical protein
MPWSDRYLAVERLAACSRLTCVERLVVDPTSILQAMSDARGEVLDAIAEGDKVVLVDRFGGTHHGSSSDVPAREIASSGWRSMFTIRDGKALQDAYMRDVLATTQHLGLAPSA